MRRRGVKGIGGITPFGWWKWRSQHAAAALFAVHAMPTFEFKRLVRQYDVTLLPSASLSPGHARLQASSPRPPELSSPLPPSSPRWLPPRPLALAVAAARVASVVHTQRYVHLRSGAAVCCSSPRFTSPAAEASRPVCCRSASSGARCFAVTRRFNHVIRRMSE